MRSIYIVTMSQIVVSENHPEGLWSFKPNYPKVYDSINHNGDNEKAFRLAEAEYRACESAMLLDENPTRAMTAITLENANGKQIYYRSVGAYPEPQPESEQEEPEVGESE